jgi:integrase
LKWDIRGKIHDGRLVRFPGDRDHDTADRLRMKIEALIRAKINGEPPPPELNTWINQMPAKLAARLVKEGLIDLRRVERGKPVNDQIDLFEGVVANRKSNSKKHAGQQASKVKKVCKALNVRVFTELNEDDVLKALKDMSMSTSTRRSYIIAMKDFAKWMVRTKRAAENPFLNMKAPGQYENVEYERQPLTVAQFQKLMKHLDTFERYRGQKSRWTAYDRKMIYWTAVRTAYRQSEMKALRRANLYLDEKPAVICLKARFTKNKTDGEVPIPADLAKALKKYVAGLEPNDRVFPFPRTSGSIVDMLRRDLTGAGVPWKLPTGEVVDYHTLRTTAITWWLDVDGLTPKRVQVLARLKTLALVQNYSRNLRIEDFGWLNKGPKLANLRPKKRAG